MSNVLSFDQYLGGADNMQVETAFPSDQKSLAYNFDTDVTAWTFKADYQTIIVDQIGFDRHTGDPNFANSTILGSFSLEEITGTEEPIVLNAVTGSVQYTLPSEMYTGAILPDARRNVPVVIVGITWTDAATPPQTQTHRWGLIQAWEPDVVIGDPVNEVDFVALGE